jgi:hypothetical protein
MTTCKVLGAFALMIALVSAAEIQSATSDQLSTFELLSAENARLKSENVQLKSKNEEWESKFAALPLDSGETLISSFLADEAAEDDELDLADGVSNIGKWHSGRKCADRCNANCWIGTDFADKECTLNVAGLKRIENTIKFVGTMEVPEWQIWHKKSSHSPSRLRGKVHCPCKTRGRTLTEAEATRAIVGQAAAMGIGIDTSKAAMGMLGSKYRHKAVDWNAKIALSVVKMLKCWKAKCSATGASSDLQIASGFGGGTEC